MNVKYFFIKMFQILLCMSYNVLGFLISVYGSAINTTTAAKNYHWLRVGMLSACDVFILKWQTFPREALT
jgi:hypothetical protein